MHPRNEAFVHFEMCIERLNSAWRTLNMVKEYQGHPLVGPAFRFALVEYAIPYTKSEGTTKKNHSLGTRYVPKDFLPLHERLVTSRKKIQAHADLSVLDPRLSYTDLDGQRLVSIAQNNITGLEELQHVDDIIRLLEGTLENMYANRDGLKQELEP